MAGVLQLLTLTLDFFFSLIPTQNKIYFLQYLRKNFAVQCVPAFTVPISTKRGVEILFSDHRFHMYHI